MNTLRLDLPEPPTENHYYAVVRNRKILSAEGRVYKQRVHNIWIKTVKHGGPAFPSAHVRVELVWTRGRLSGDLDNRIKPTLDALKGLAYTDDKQVVQIHAYRRDLKGHPAMMVTVSDLIP